MKIIIVGAGQVGSSLSINLVKEGNDVTLIDKSQEHVTGMVRLKLYKGSVRTVGRWSEHSLYSEAHVTFEEDAGAYDQSDAAGFIQLNALRLKLLAARKRRLG